MYLKKKGQLLFWMEYPVDKKVLDEGERVSLKLNIQKIKIMASGPITPWQIEREKVGTVTNFIFLSCKITVDSDCSHEIKRCLSLEEKL